MKLAECQRKLFEEFSQIIRENRLSHAYLFSGDFGSLDMAIWLAQSRVLFHREIFQMLNWLNRKGRL